MRTRIGVTLTGAGGSGKTRLAIEVTETVSGQYPDGIRFADLAVITDADGVGDAVARALGLIDNGVLEDQITRIAVHLESRAILCILDNCEHLLDSCAELVEAAMERRGASRLFATSREPLGVPGEQVYLVPSLDARTDATTLFTARASEVRPELIIDDATAEVVAKICERLDGIPLAIELAAVRVNQLTPTQPLERLGDRFRLLTGGRRRVRATTCSTRRSARSSLTRGVPQQLLDSTPAEAVTTRRRATRSPSCPPAIRQLGHP